MARARNIKPGFFRNADLVELPVETRLLFPGLWVLADRAGRLEDRPKQIKMDIFPADSFDVEAMLVQLHDAGLILRYECDGKRYIQVVNFEKHQNPHRDEKASTIPSPYQHCANTVSAQCQHEEGTNPTRLIPDSLIPDSLNLIPDTKQTGADVPVGCQLPDGFEDAWTLYPQRPGRSKADAMRAWNARIKEGVPPSLLIDGVRRYSAYCQGTNAEPQYVKQPATFFGPGHHYLSDWTVPAARASPQFDAKSADRKRAAAELTGVPITELGGHQHERIEREINPPIRIAGALG